MIMSPALKERMRYALASEKERDELETLVGGSALVGDVFYCDPTNGDDENDGTTVDTAKATMNAAIGLCTADAGDVIVRLPGTETVTETIEFDVGGITVVAADYGLSPQGNGEHFATLADESFTDGPVATITARCAIAGLGFVSRDAGTTFFSGAALLIGGEGAATPFGVHLYECRFPKWNVDNRIGVAVEGSTDCTIERCTFEGVGADFEAGIYVQGACQNLHILGNWFRDCTYAVEYGVFAGGGPDALIAHNHVLTADKLLDSNNQDAPTLVADNWLGVGTGTSAFDVSIATLDGNNIFVADNHYKET